MALVAGGTVVAIVTGGVGWERSVLAIGTACETRDVRSICREKRGERAELPEFTMQVTLLQGIVDCLQGVRSASAHRHGGVSRRLVAAIKRVA